MKMKKMSIEQLHLFMFYYLFMIEANFADSEIEFEKSMAPHMTTIIYSMTNELETYMKNNCKIK